jgi:predicted ATPase
MSKNKAIIHHIGLKNFKGYQEADIPLAPITLFFGPNSAGKSTVFQVLYLLKQTLQFAPDNVPLLFKYSKDENGTNDGYVDLGSFEDVVFDHDLSRTVSIEINGQRCSFVQKGGRLMLTDIVVNEGHSDSEIASSYAIETGELSILTGEHRIKYCDGAYRHINKSPFYEWAYDLLHKHREHIVWALEQNCLISSLEEFCGDMMPGEEVIDFGVISEEEWKVRKNLRDEMFSALINVCKISDKNEFAGKQEENPDWENYSTARENIRKYHLGNEIDKRIIVTPNEYKVNHITSEYVKWENPFERGVKYRVALSPDKIENELLKKYFLVFRGKLKEICDTNYYKKILAANRQAVEKQIKFFESDFSEKELWDMIGVCVEGIEIKIRHFIPDDFAAFEERGDNKIENLLRLLAISGIYISVEIDGRFEGQKDVHRTYGRIRTDWNGWNSLPTLKRDEVHNFGNSFVYLPEWMTNQPVSGKYPEKMVMSSLQGREDFISWLGRKESPSLNGHRVIFNNHFKPVGATRTEPKRVYWGTGIAIDQVGFRGEWMGDALIDPDNKREINRWMKLLTGYEVERSPIGKLLPGAYVLQVRDEAVRDDGHYVSIRDVGFGISQILPLVAQLVVAKNSIITIEQPESQIHPQMQAKFADLVVESMTKNGNQVLVETHSEHIILRLLRRLRESAKRPETERSLQASDVGVLYVSPSPNGSNINRIEISDNGQILSPWPGGFFPERVAEIFGEA